MTFPTLFNIYINDLTADLPGGVNVSLCTLTSWLPVTSRSSDRDVTVAEAKVQRALEKLETCAVKWKMPVSLEETTSIIITLEPDEVAREVNLKFNNRCVDHCPTPTFLGSLWTAL